MAIKDRLITGESQLKALPSCVIDKLSDTYINTQARVSEINQRTWIGLSCLAAATLCFGYLQYPHAEGDLVKTLGMIPAAYLAAPTWELPVHNGITDMVTNYEASLEMAKYLGIAFFAAALTVFGVETIARKSQERFGFSPEVLAGKANIRLLADRDPLLMFMHTDPGILAADIVEQRTKETQPIIFAQQDEIPIKLVTALRKNKGGWLHVSDVHEGDSALDKLRSKTDPETVYAALYGQSTSTPFGLPEGKGDYGVAEVLMVLNEVTTRFPMSDRRAIAFMPKGHLRKATGTKHKETIDQFLQKKAQERKIDLSIYDPGTLLLSQLIEQYRNLFHTNPKMIGYLAEDSFFDGLNDLLSRYNRANRTKIKLCGDMDGDVVLIHGKNPAVVAELTNEVHGEKDPGKTLICPVIQNKYLGLAFDSHINIGRPAHVQRDNIHKIVASQIILSVFHEWMSLIRANKRSN